MQITISGHHVEINDTLRDYVNTKFTRLQRHADHMTTVHVILRVEKFINFAEATVHIAGHDIFAEADDKDMYAAIDALADKLDRQLRKHKEKRIQREQG